MPTSLPLPSPPPTLHHSHSSDGSTSSTAHRIRAIHILTVALMTALFAYTVYALAAMLPAYTLVTLVSLLSAYTLGALFPPDIATLISPRPVAPPPEQNTPAAHAYTAQLEAALSALPLLAEMRAAPDAGAWYEVRPYADFPSAHAARSLVAGALRGPGRLALLPLVRARRDNTASVAVVHVGNGVCGLDGIVHGGLLAAVVDEALGHTAVFNLPDKIGVTANLTMDFKAPTRTEQFVVIRSYLVEVKGRKAVVAGRLEDVHGMLLADVRATFVQPRYAKVLAAVREALGKPLDPRLTTAGPGASMALDISVEDGAR